MSSMGGSPRSASSTAAAGGAAPATGVKRVGGLGAKLLSKMGWQAGKGLGAREDGRVEPVRARKREQQLGLGANKNAKLSDPWWDRLMEQAYGPPQAQHPVPHLVPDLLAACEGVRLRPHGTAKLARLAAHDRAAHHHPTSDHDSDSSHSSLHRHLRLDSHLLPPGGGPHGQQDQEKHRVDPSTPATTRTGSDDEPAPEPPTEPETQPEQDKGKVEKRKRKDKREKGKLKSKIKKKRKHKESKKLRTAKKDKS